jgi:biopolymer transport protein ExbD
MPTADCQVHIPSTFLDRPTGVELQLTPLIDCVFLLMVYFIWSSSFAVVELTLPSELSAEPIGGGAASNTEPPLPAADFEPTVVRILWQDGTVSWTVNDAPLATLAELRRTLETIARIKRDAPLVLDPDPEVPLGDAIDVFDLTRLASFEKVQFAAGDESRSP